MRTMGRNEYKALLMNNAKQKKQLKYVAIELLDKCIYKCPHCYVKDKYNTMIPTKDFYRIVDQLVACDCTWLLLTGGDPLLHPDFLDMYKYTYGKGIKVTVFTNGYLINQDILDCFEKFPPELVELTIYGGTPNSYDQYVGITGAYDVFDRALDSLKGIGVNTRIKTILMPETISEINYIEEYARKKEIEFRYDGFVVPRIDGDMSPCNHFRLAPETVFKMDMKVEGYIEAQIEKRKQYMKKSDINELYSCDAGYNSVFIDASCQMSICTFARHINIALNENISVREGQEYLIELIKSKRPLDEFDKCFNCDKKALCRYCPGQFLLENGNEYEPIKWHCDYANLVLDAIYKKED